MSRKYKIYIATVTFLLFLYTWAVIAPPHNAKAVPIEDVLFWVQMLSGSSWPELKDHTASPFWLAVGATIQTMLSVGPLLSIIWLGRRLLTERSTPMNLTALLAEHDRALKASIAAMIERKCSTDVARQLDPELKDIFKKESEEWQAKVREILGRERAKEVFAKMNETV